MSRLDLSFVLRDGLFSASRLLNQADRRRAYSLVVLAHPDITAQHWEAFARRHGRAARQDQAGLMAVKDQRHHVHAIFRYTADCWQLVQRGRMLRLHGVIMAQLPGHAIVNALAECAERLAVHFDCPTISLDVPAGILHSYALRQDDVVVGQAMIAALEAAGFWMAEITMMRPLATP